MPNWVYNDVLVKGGDSGKVKEFFDTCFKRSDETHELYFDFNTLIPRPASEEENWYIWQIDNWGTKWNALETSFQNDTDGEDWVEEQDSVQFGFNTAWGAPIPIFKEIARRFPDLTFDITCEEELRAFGYDITIDCGRMTVTDMEFPPDEDEETMGVDSTGEEEADPARDVLKPKDVGTVTEFCNECEHEVLLEAEFRIQRCPICNAGIIPCSLCDMDDVVCNKCELSKELDRKTSRGETV